MRLLRWVGTQTATPISLALTPATLTLSAGTLTPSPGTASITLTPATATLSAGTLAASVTGTASIALTPATLTLTGGTVGGLDPSYTVPGAADEGGYAPHRPALPTRPIRVARRRRYLASKSCTFGIRAVRYRHARPGTHSHTAHITHRATRPATTSRAHAAGMTGSSTRSAHHDAEMRCDMYRPHSPERVAARLAELYAELL